MAVIWAGRNKERHFVQPNWVFQTVGFIRLMRLLSTDCQRIAPKRSIHWES